MFSVCFFDVVQDGRDILFAHSDTGHVWSQECKERRDAWEVGLTG